MLPLGENLIAILSEHRRQQLQERLRAGAEWTDEGWVFANQLGGPIEHRNDLREWKTVLSEAGVRDVRLHHARHTYATTLLASGIDQRIVIDMLGWSRLSMTERYQHVVPEMRREAAQQAENQIWGSLNWRPTTGLSARLRCHHPE